MDTRQQFSAHDARKEMKQAFAMARASFNIPYEKCGDWLDESASTIKAWCDPSRAHCPPMWALWRLRQCHEGMAAYIETWMDARAKSDAVGPVASTLEAQMNCMVGSISRVLESHSLASMDGVYDPVEAARNLAVLIAHRRDVERAITKTHERLGNAKTEPKLAAVRT